MTLLEDLHLKLHVTGRLQRKQGQVDRTAPATSWQGMRTKGAGKTVASAGVVKVSSREASSGRKKQAAKAGKFFALHLVIVNLSKAENYTAPGT